jgi:hypothetical protein
MKVRFLAEAEYYNKFYFKCISSDDYALGFKFLDWIRKREGKTCKRETFFITLETQSDRRKLKQNRAVWVLVTAIFENMEGRKPTETEKYDLYCDLLAEYALKVPSKINKNTLRPAHISESSVKEAAFFIDGLLGHLASESGLSVDLHSGVNDVMREWHQWRGGMEYDPIDEVLNEKEWRERRFFSDASGLCGDIELCHIVSRGADAAAINFAWNWLALTRKEHRFQHQYGWGKFLGLYPHLRGRVNRARKLADKLEMDFKGAREAETRREKSL